DLASAQVLRTRYQTGDACEVPPAVPQTPFRIERILPPYPVPAAQPFPWGFSYWPSHSTYSAQPLVTYLKRGSTQAFTRASAQAYAFRCWICARMPSCGVSKEFPFIPLEVTPIPQKLFWSRVTAEPEKVKFPVSRQDCAKAMSPRTPSACPSER